MPFDIKNLHQPARFYWDEAKTEWIEVRTLTGKALMDLRKSTTTKKVDYWRPDKSTEKPFRYEFTEMNDELFNELFWDQQIVSWNFTDPEGVAIPCTKENKMLLMGNSNEFATWVMGCLSQLDKDEKKRAEKSEKN
jgi:hypothetical protein